MIWIGDKPGTLVERPTPRDTALLDATSIVLSGELLQGTPPTAMAVAALANVVDALVLYGRVATRRPSLDRNGRFERALEGTGILPEFLEYSENENLAVLHSIQRKWGRTLSLIEIDEDGNPFIPSGCDDPAWAKLAKVLVPPQREAPPTGPELYAILKGEPEDEPNSLFTSEGFEVWHSFYNDLRYDRTTHYYVYDPDGGTHKETRLGPLMARGTQLLAYRAELYVLLSAKYGLPYLPDCARSTLMLALSGGFNQRTQDAVRVALRHLEGGELEYDRSAAELLGLPTPPLRIPLLLTCVLDAAKNRSRVLDEARALSRSKAARRLRDYLNRLNSLMAGDSPDIAEARRMMSGLLTACEEFNLSLGNPTRAGTDYKSDIGFIAQSLLSVGSGWIMGHVDPPTAVQSIIAESAKIGRSGLIRRWLLRRQLAFLRDPIAIHRGKVSLDDLLLRHFGETLPVTDWEMLAAARGLS